jgi:hypothetical protein
LEQIYLFLMLSSVWAVIYLSREKFLIDGCFPFMLTSFVALIASLLNKYLQFFLVVFGIPLALIVWFCKILIEFGFFTFQQAK